MEEVSGPWCGRLGSPAGDLKKVAKQESDFMKVVNVTFLFMHRILVNFLLPQMLDWRLCTVLLRMVQE